MPKSVADFTVKKSNFLPAAGALLIGVSCFSEAG
jgi:hypothetical protein